MFLAPVQASSQAHTADSVGITYQDHRVSIASIKKMSTLSFRVTGAGTDPVRIHFPPGGTSTSVVLYKILRSGKKQFINTVGITGGEDLDYFIFTEKDAGRYFVRYSSCHWGTKLWLTIR